MKSNKTATILAIAIMAALGSTTALAVDNFGWYAGGNIGQASADIDDARIINDLSNAGLSTTAFLGGNDRNLGYKVFGGYQFNRHFAIEGGYFNLGDAGYQATTFPAGALTGRERADGLNLDMVGVLPLSENWSALGRAGVIYGQTRDTWTGTGAAVGLDARSTDRFTSYKYGVGLQYDVSDRIGLRIEAERYNIDNALAINKNIDLLSIGVVGYFGAARSAAPEPVASQRSCEGMDADGDGVGDCDDQCLDSQAGQDIGADGCPAPMAIDLKGVHFDFDQSTLRPDAVAVLDEAIEILVKYPQMRVEVSGHTDSIGGEEYNQELSERRAQIVYGYLTGHGIDASRLIGPNGYGETRPIAPNTNEDGSDNPEGRTQNRRTELNVNN